MREVLDPVKTRPNWAQRLKQGLILAIILLMAAGILVLIAGNWNTWASERVAQETDDACLRKVAGPVATVAQPKQTSSQRKLELTHRNWRSLMRGAESTGPNRTWTAQYRSGGGRKL
jgi:hypothetical protein